jgi:hypothetical protein
MSAAPNFAPFRQKSLGDCTRPLLPTQGWLTCLTKDGHVLKGTCGLMDIQHPVVLDDHRVVSAQSQLWGCPSIKGCTHPPGDVGGFLGSINLLASHTPIPSGYVRQGLDSKPSEGGVKPRGKKSSGQSFHFPPGPGWNDRDPRESIDSQPVVVVENHVS